MMPELGKYATEVLSAYAVSLIILVLFVLASLWRARRVRNELRKVEERKVQNG
ncbi:Heme exporter protein D (CcmD) [Pseudoruegeria aquimaris]|uniref:Heme exporter protein D n=1 Tax=Pseudoruegeria aquimaris TaxID=393663 RepID=A0A1Y5SJ41_9RHOB|nr:heme exporter protein CcmD [Pseudoruegeria aquimaris]SLN42003.1 Heme exporter protein D (CcmD) [Pseudoruegeria aquimaris]